MPAPILVEVYAPQPRPRELAALISSCSRAAAPNECVTAETRTGEPPLGVAIVRRLGDSARIELGLRGVVDAEWSTRDLVFQPADDELERYRAIGFAIGTLVARAVEPPPPRAASRARPTSRTTSPERAPTPGTAPVTQPGLEPEPEAAPAPAPTPRVATAPSRSVGSSRSSDQQASGRSTWLDLSGGLGLGLIPGAPRAGGALRASSELVVDGPFALAETGYAERTGTAALRMRWLKLALGIGHPLLASRGPVGVDARLSLTLDRLSMTAVDGPESEGAARWRPGVAAAVDAHFSAVGPLRVVLTASTLLDPKPTVVKVRGTEVGETPAVGFDGFVGLRLRLR